MKSLKLFTVLLAISLFVIGCDKGEPQETVKVSNEPDLQTDGLTESDNDYWARENLDLQAVGTLFEKSNNVQEFERNLNSNNGINNLDLNGDGYTDYISVAEYDDRYDDERGFSLFSRFDGDSIQEIARIVFDRDRPDQRGARILLTGNEQIYGNNYNYQGDWLDKGLAIADWVFGDRDNGDFNDSPYYDDGYYRSPYYYDNYPTSYDPYRVVETPVYRERISTYTVNPVFVEIKEPKRNYKIKSPYKGRSYDKIYARLAEPSEQQTVFIKTNPRPKKFKDKDWSKSRKDDKVFNKMEKADKSGKAKKDKFDDRKEEKAERKAERRDEKRDKRQDKKVKNVKKSEKSKGKKAVSQNDRKPKAKKGNDGGGKGKSKGDKKDGKN